MSEKIDELGLLKLLFECAHRESALFWVRSNFIMAVNSALLGGVFLYSQVEHKISGGMLVGPCIVGLVLTIYWGFMNAASRRLNHAYVSDGKKLVEGNQYLKSVLIESVSKNVPSSSVDDSGLPFIKKIWPSATALNYLFILGYGVCWILLINTA